MECRTILTLDGNLTDKGFRVRLELFLGGQSAPEFELFGNLPAQPTLAALVDEHWHVRYRQCGIAYRIEPRNIACVSSLMDLQRACKVSARWLRDHFNGWLAAPEFRELEREVLAASALDRHLWLSIRTEDPVAQRLPWSDWHIGKRFATFEWGLSPLNAQSLYPCTKHHPHLSDPVRILAVLGLDRDLNLQSDRQTWSRLPDVQLHTLQQPSRQELFETLWSQPWDILFFGGHGVLRQDAIQIELNETDVLSLEELGHALNRAAAQGLKVGILNCCEGLSLAEQLSGCHVPFAIAMREAVPDLVAIQFLENFLDAYHHGLSLYQAFGTARRQLQALEAQFPWASWLPVVYQHPYAIAPHWPWPHPINLQDFNSSQSSINDAMPAEAVGSSLLFPIDDRQQRRAMQPVALNSTPDHSIRDHSTLDHSVMNTQIIHDSVVTNQDVHDSVVTNQDVHDSVVTNQASEDRSVSPHVAHDLAALWFDTNPVNQNSVNQRLINQNSVNQRLINQNSVSQNLVPQNPVHQDRWQRGWAIAQQAGRSIAVAGLAGAIAIALQTSGWLEPLELKAFDHLTHFHAGPEFLDPRIVIVMIDDYDVEYQQQKGWGLGTTSLANPVLVQAWPAIEALEPSAVMLDIYRPDGLGLDLTERWSANPNFFAVCKLPDPNSGDPDGVAPPTGVAQEQIGFTDLIPDPDGIRRRWLLAMAHVQQLRPCQANYNIGLIAADRYITQQLHVSEATTPDGQWGYGSVMIPGIEDQAGGYSTVDTRGRQILMRYRNRQFREVPLRMLLQPDHRDRTLETLRANHDHPLVLIGSFVKLPNRGQLDYHATPLRTMPGVVWQAHAIAQLLDVVQGKEPLLRPVPWPMRNLWIGGAAIATVASWIGLGKLRLSQQRRRWLRVGIGIGWMGIVVCVVTIAWPWGWWLPLTGPGVAIALSLVGMTVRSGLWSQHRRACR